MKKKHVYLIILMIALIGCSGGGSNSETPEQANTAPELVGLIDFAIDENTTEITTIQATDAEGDNITYSIEGSDSALMIIGSSSGELSFISPPDYENPQDSNQDNIYEVTVIASDGSLSSSLEIVISVNDVLEGMGGSNMLLMGNSFFRPYAERFSELALDADFLEHQDNLVFRGGDNGTPIGLWTNEDTNTEINFLGNSNESVALTITPNDNGFIFSQQMVGGSISIPDVYEVDEIAVAVRSDVNVILNPSGEEIETDNLTVQE